MDGWERARPGEAGGIDTVLNGNISWDQGGKDFVYCWELDFIV